MQCICINGVNLCWFLVYFNTIIFVLNITIGCNKGISNLY